MKKILFIIIVSLFLNLGLVYAVTPLELNEAKGLIDSNVSCSSLSDSQLEIIGEYEMEQMHPGEAHKAMHKMMGMQEGSEAEEQFHINMAKTIYCGESSGMMSSGGMMSMMNMMDGGMMGNYLLSYGYGNYSYWSIFWILFFAVVIFLIIWLVYKFKIKKETIETPLEILKKRFARGKITKKQFEDMKKEIGE